VTDATPPRLAWVTVATAAELAPGQAMQVTLGERRLALFCLADGSWRAIEDPCPHEGFPLHDGDVTDHRVTCPLHHWTFDLDDGSCLFGSRPVRSYPVRVEHGEIQVASRPPDPAAQQQLLARLEAAIAVEQDAALDAMLLRGLELEIPPGDLLEVATRRASPRLQEPLQALTRILELHPDLPAETVVHAGLRAATRPPRHPFSPPAAPATTDPGRFAGDDGPHLRRRIALALDQGRGQDAADAALAYLALGAAPRDLARDLLQVALGRHPDLLPRAVAVTTDAYRWAEDPTSLLELVGSLAVPYDP
jgi:nitrite reductase (NADH) small subunit